MKKKTVRKAAAFVLALVTAGSLCACGTAKNTGETEKTAASEAATAAQSTSAGTTAAATSSPAETGTSTAESGGKTEATKWSYPVPDESALETVRADYKQDTKALALDMKKWNYDSENKVWYQIGISYCSDPQDKTYESMGIYVPGAYMTGKKNGNGTYTCTVNAEGKAGSYTAATAPVVFPVNTPGYSAQAAPAEYSYNGLSDYLNAGLIYVYAGMRGRAGMTGGPSAGNDTKTAAETTSAAAGTDTVSGGAPWGVTDLKAAIRYYRLNSASLPGDTNELYTFGMSGGGAQSALMGATGDSSLYYPYLTAIGSAMFDKSGNYVSDAVTGSMCWCPITTLGVGSEAYEWNMGQFSTADTRAEGTWTKALSNDMAKAYADYINRLGLRDSDGKKLVLTESSSGTDMAGSYYDYLKSVIEKSLNDFLSVTKFPYTESTAFNASGNFGGGGNTPQGNGVQGSGNGAAGNGEAAAGPAGMGQGGPQGQNGDSSTARTYATVQDYISSLNTDGTWIRYDAANNTAAITGIGDFVTHCKNATKGVGAFDMPDRSQGENGLFGNGSTVSLHFDATEGKLISQNQDSYAALSGWDSSYPSAFTEDLARTDELGTEMGTRVNMYDPMFFTADTQRGFDTSNVARHWRIRTGIDQGDTALTTETNLALALQNNGKVDDVDFATIWGMKHTMAELTGNSTSNFIAWVQKSVSADRK